MARSNQAPDTDLTPRAASRLAAGLLVLYVAPAAGMVVALLWTRMAATQSWYFGWFFSLAASHGDALTEIHQLLLPLLTLFSVSTFRQLSGQSVVVLGGFVLGSFLLVIGLEVLLGTPALTENLAGLNFDGAALKAADSMLRRMRESQTMYLALLIGLRVPAGAAGNKGASEAAA